MSVFFLISNLYNHNILGNSVADPNSPPFAASCSTTSLGAWMGSCMSSDSPAVATAAAGAPIYREEDAYFSSRTSICSKRWIGWKKGTEEKRKRGGGLFDRKAVSGEGDGAAEELLLVPGRMCINGASEVACLFTQQGKKGTNQDAMIVWEVNLSLRLI